MRFTGISGICIFGLLAATAIGQQNKPNFSGKWQANTEKCQLHSGNTSIVSLTIEQKGPSIHVVKGLEIAGKKSVVEFTCTTDGKDCDANGTKVSLWYSGASLVEMEVSDAAVTSISLTLAGDAKSIDATVKYISPKTDDDTMVFDKL